MLWNVVSLANMLSLALLRLSIQLIVSFRQILEKEKGKESSGFVQQQKIDAGLMLV